MDGIGARERKIPVPRMPLAHRASADGTSARAVCASITARHPGSIMQHRRMNDGPYVHTSIPPDPARSSSAADNG